MIFFLRTAHRDTEAFYLVAMDKGSQKGNTNHTKVLAPSQEMAIVGEVQVADSNMTGQLLLLNEAADDRAENQYGLFAMMSGLANTPADAWFTPPLVNLW